MDTETAFDQGFLVPILVDPIWPGDHMQYRIQAYLRMATPLFPMFDTVRVDTHFFFVPNRLVWSNWVKMHGEQDTPGASIAFQVPRVPLGVGVEDNVGSLYDHMGLPVKGQMGLGGHLINALPFRGYNLIYNQWFRDENFCAPAAFVTNDGPDTNSWYNLLKRAKSADYFTTALPQPQKFTAPNVPLLGTAPITGIGQSVQTYPIVNIAVSETGGVAAVYPNSQGPIQTAGNFYIKGTAAAGGYPEIYANLSAATGVSINQLRQAWMIQTLLERDARGGTRYIELIRSHFGVINPDFRLQRPEYIGGGQSDLNITPIAQTAPTAGVPLGALGGAATAAGSHNASYAATEHGYVIGLISVKSELSYQQGIERHWKYLTRYDWMYPELTQLGEQAVNSYEIYADGTVSDFDVFGYQERFQELRTKQSEVTGIMRSTAVGTLDPWHLAQKFTSRPVLNQTFIEDTAPMSRILQQEP